MRSFWSIVLLCMAALFATSALAQDIDGEDDPGDIFAKDSSSDTAKDEEAAPKKKETGSSEMVIDAESVHQTDASGQLIDADFLSLGGTAAWLDRNGLGAHLGVGGYTCAREYCNTTLDVSILGSIAGTLGAFYKLSPNWSLFGDVTFARLNTNFRSSSTNDYVISADNHGFVFSFLVGAAFHLPVKGWMDVYTRIGLGPIILKETISDEAFHKWAGIDIQWGLGTDFYFWSVGALKNFALGPYMAFDFPIWPKICDNRDGIEDCRRPSEMEDNDTYFWNKAPIAFQIGIEAKFHFTLGGKKDTPTSGEVQIGTPKKEDGAKDGEEKPAGESADEDATNDATGGEGSDAEADAEASGDANWDM